MERTLTKYMAYEVRSIPCNHATVIQKHFPCKLL